MAGLLLLVIQQKTKCCWGIFEQGGSDPLPLYLFKFLKNPDQSWQQLTTKPLDQLTLSRYRVLSGFIGKRALLTI